MEGGDNKSKIWDCVVVGGGLVGMATAACLAKNLKKVLLISARHVSDEIKARSSASAGLVAFRGVNEKTALNCHAYKKWTDLGAAHNIQLYVLTTAMHVFPIEENDDFEERIRTGNTNSNRETVSKLTADLDRICSQWRSAKGKVGGVVLDEDEDDEEVVVESIVERESGIWWMEDCLAVLMKSYEKAGGNIQIAEVEDVEINFKSMEEASEQIPWQEVRLHTNKGVIISKRLVIAAGRRSAQIAQMLDWSLNCKVEKEYWFSFKATGNDLVLTNGTPILYLGGYTLIPAFSRAGIVKIKSLERIACDGETMEPDNPESFERLQNDIVRFVKKYLPSLDPEPLFSKSKTILSAPDRNFYIDRHRKYSNIVVATGISSDEMFLAPVIGEIATSMILCQPINYDVARFKTDRYQTEVDVGALMGQDFREEFAEVGSGSYLENSNVTIEPVAKMVEDDNQTREPNA